MINQFDTVLFVEQAISRWGPKVSYSWDVSFRVDVEWTPHYRALYDDDDSISQFVAQFETQVHNELLPLERRWAACSGYRQEPGMVLRGVDDAGQAVVVQVQSGHTGALPGLLPYLYLPKTVDALRRHVGRVYGVAFKEVQPIGSQPALVYSMGAGLTFKGASIIEALIVALEAQQRA